MKKSQQQQQQDQSNKQYSAGNTADHWFTDDIFLKSGFMHK